MSEEAIQGPNEVVDYSEEVVTLRQQVIDLNAKLEANTAEANMAIAVLRDQRNAAQDQAAQVQTKLEIALQQAQKPKA